MLKNEETTRNFFRWSIEALGLTISIDKHGIVRHVGQAYAEILEMDAADILGQHIMKIVPNTCMLQVLETGQPEYESVFIMKNHWPIVVNRYPIRDENGDIQGVICITGLTDLSRFSALQEKIANLLKENQRYKHKLDELYKSITEDLVIGCSEQTLYAMEQVRKVADSDLTVTFTGETGTGKEVFAKYLQQLSSRNHENFVKINCAAIPKDLLESELFGYDEGAFSGAKKGGKKGKFEIADNGTILLDEIGEIPIELQAKLLRVLQEKEVERVGGLAAKKINVRVICCTNQKLEDLVREGKFREDLYYRINVVEIRIPPLRERLDDLASLCRHFIRKINKTNGILVDGITDGVIDLFFHHDWPGNIRELEHVLERACVISPHGVLEVEHFDFFVPRLSNKQMPGAASQTLNDKRRWLERQALIDALRKTGGNKSQAARLLGIPRSMLYEKLKTLGIAPEQPAKM